MELMSRDSKVLLTTLRVADGNLYIHRCWHCNSTHFVQTKKRKNYHAKIKSHHQYTYTYFFCNTENAFKFIIAYIKTQNNTSFA